MPGVNPGGKAVVEEAWNTDQSVRLASGRIRDSAAATAPRVSKPLRAIVAAIIVSVGFWALLFHFL